MLIVSLIDYLVQFSGAIIIRCHEIEKLPCSLKVEKSAVDSA